MMQRRLVNVDLGDVRHQVGSRREEEKGVPSCSAVSVGSSADPTGILT